MPVRPPPAGHAATGFAVVRLDGEVLHSSGTPPARFRNTSRAAIATAFADRVWTDRHLMRAHLDRAYAEGEAQDEFDVLQDDGGRCRLTLRTCRLDGGPEPLLLIAHVDGGASRTAGAEDEPRAAGRPGVGAVPPAVRRPESRPGGGVADEASAVLADLVGIDGRFATGAPVDPEAVEELVARVVALRGRVARHVRGLVLREDDGPVPGLDECVLALEHLRRAIQLVAEIADDVG